MRKIQYPDFFNIQRGDAMFNAKRKEREKQAQEQLDAYIAQGAVFEAAVAEAMNIKDPAEKILKFSEIGNNIAAHTTAINEAATCTEPGEMTRIGTLLAAPTTLASMPLGVHIALAFGFGLGGIGLPIFVGYMASSFVAPCIGGAFLDARKDKKNALKTKANLEKIKGHVEKIDGLSKQISETIKTLVSDQTAQICQSPLYEEFLQKMPHLTEQFKGAAAKRIAEAAAPADANNSAQNPPAPKRQMGNYKHLNSALGE